MSSSQPANTPSRFVTFSIVKEEAPRTVVPIYPSAAPEQPSRSCWYHRASHRKSRLTCRPFRTLLDAPSSVSPATVALFWSDEARAAAKWLLEALADALEETDTDQHLQHHPH
jgi:hypothetical protein